MKEHIEITPDGKYRVVIEIDRDGYVSVRFEEIDDEETIYD